MSRYVCVQDCSILCIGFLPNYSCNSNSFRELTSYSTSAFSFLRWLLLAVLLTNSHWSQILHPEPHKPSRSPCQFCAQSEFPAPSSASKLARLIKLPKKAVSTPCKAHSS